MKLVQAYRGRQRLIRDKDGHQSAADKIVTEPDRAIQRQTVPGTTRQDR